MEGVLTYVNKAGSVSPWNEGEGQVVHVPVDGCRVSALKSRFDCLKNLELQNLGNMPLYYNHPFQN